MLKQLQDYFQENLPDYLDLLQEMVSINSFTANAAGVNALAGLTAERFADLGFKAEQIQSANPSFGKHLVLTRKGRTNLVLGLVSHLDTVFPPEEEAANNFTWRVEGDRIYGPGTNDIKGGTVMIYMVLDAIRAFVMPATDQEAIYVPHDPDAHDPYAVEGEERIGWSLAHLVVHVTASSE